MNLSRQQIGALLFVERNGAAKPTARRPIRGIRLQTWKSLLAGAYSGCDGPNAGLLAWSDADGYTLTQRGREALTALLRAGRIA